MLNSSINAPVMIKTLQFYRFVFVQMVFFSHFTWGNIGAFDFGGECGVSFFFILSGFVLSVSTSARSGENMLTRKQLMAKQLLKFYPLHIIILSVFVLFDLIVAGKIDIIKLFLNVFLLQSWIPDNSFNFAFNGVSWFLSDIMFFYFLFPWLYSRIVLAPLKRLLQTVIIVLLLYIAFVFVVPEGHINTLLYVFPPIRVLDFAIGILIYRLYKTDFTQSLKHFLEHKDNRIAVVLAEVAIMLIIVVTWAVYDSLPERISVVLLFWLPLSAVIYISAVTDNAGGPLARVFCASPFLWLGSLSLEIFMSHLFVIMAGRAFAAHYGIDLGYAATAVIEIVITILVAFLLKKYFADKIYVALKKYVIKS